MAKPLMSDAELRRRKKLQGQISRTTSTLGLAGVGVGTAAVLASKKPGTLKHMRKVPGMKKITADKLKDAGLYTSLTSGGIGGVGGYNFARYTNAESRKRAKPPEPVKKGVGMDMGYYGDEGNPVEIPAIPIEVEKAWSPSASNYDSERGRKKRATAYQGAAVATGGAGGAYAVHHARKAGKKSNLKPVQMSRAKDIPTTMKDAKGKPLKTRRSATFTQTKPATLVEEKAIPLKDFEAAGKSIRRSGGKAALGLGAVGAAAGTTYAIGRKKKSGSWDPYAKRDSVSAFGVDHESSRPLNTEWTAP